MNRFRRGLLISVIAMLLLTTTLRISFLLQGIAYCSASPASISILPEGGYVGDEVRVSGQINTPNGSYIIFFDQEEVQRGTAVGTVVNDTFLVPPRPLGNYTVTLHDEAQGINFTTHFSLQPAYSVETVVPSPPRQLQEGESVQILVKVTGGAEDTRYLGNVTVSDPSGLVFHYRTLRLTSTLQTGSGKGNVTYPTDFSGGAHTNYTGLYSVAFNGTLASGNFTVALTDKSEYVRRYLIRGEEEAGLVDIQGSGYDNETVDINIAYYDGDILIPVLSTQGNASNGILQYNWEIPENITLATYRVILTSEMSDKPIEDAQNFTVIEIMVSCQAVNKYDQEPLADVSVKAYHLALGSAFFIDDRRTNGTGWVDFLVEGRGFYSFGIYWREARVGSLNLTNVGGDATGYVLRNRFHIESELAQVTMKVSSGEGPLPFIEVALRNVTSVPSRIPSVETDYSGIVTTHAFTDVSYRIEARRYGHLFFNQSIGNVTETVGTLTEPYPIQCPTLTLFVAVLDSKEQPIRGASVEMIEWGSGRVAAEGETSEWGSVRLDSIFGRYKVRVYDYSELWGETVLVNETVVDVIRDEFYLLVRCGRVNVTLSVRVVDYFGNPIPNAMVKLEQEGREVLSLTTNSDGVVRKEGILGGDYRISLYVAGRLTTARSLTVADSEQLLLRSRDYVVIWGVPFISNRLVTGILLAVMVGAVMLLTYRRRLKQS